MSSTILVPLSSVDQAGVETSASVFAYVVLGTIDVDGLRQAALRVVDKWRLLAGTVEYSNKNYNIRVPLGPLPEGRVYFTTATSAAPLGIVFPELGHNSSVLLERPPLSCFRHKNTPNSLSGHAKPPHPIVSIHVSTYSDYTCIGISCPHGALDGTGQAMVVHAIDAELHGRAWTPPAFGPTNLMQKILDQLNTGEALYKEEPPALANLKREFPALGAGSLAAFAGKVGYEYLWHKAEDRGIFLGKNVVEKIVAQAKQDAKEAGNGAFISTSDVLVAWVIKSIYDSEPLDEKQKVALVSALSFRSVLAKIDPTIETYPHNVVTPCVSELTSQSAIKKGRFADLALHHRKAVEGVRNLPYIQSWARHINSQGRPSIPSRRRGLDVWTFTNQVLARPTDISFGVPTSAFFYFFCPLQIEHTTVINKLNDGYVLNLMCRRNRWKAIEAALQKLQAA
ncbi:hypothetical protein AURDEDRAFT_115134 [Auricularia subglabra TFB-10046 SS5]|nr:hypothetical protein AURDEDRAFT_115134 [Auricularia subglabra TFB-10046 SS5]